MRTRTQRVLRLGAAAALLLTVLILPALAAVTATQEPTGGPDTVYVAGNPALYPLEYYNPSEERYEGIVPLVLERVSADTGLDFCYVSAGTQNVQRRLAKNRQVEMLSAYVPDGQTDAYLSGTQLVLTVAWEGEPVDVCLAFTPIASQELIDAVTQSVQKLSRDELADMVLSYTLGKEAPKNQTWILWAVGAALALALICIVILLVTMAKRSRKGKDDGLTDKSTGIGNKDYFKKYYDSYITDKTRSLYYVAHLAFDIRWTNQYLGTEVTERILKTSANTLMEDVRDTDFAARITGGTFAVAFLCNNQTDAAQYIQRLLIQLDRNLPEGNAVFRAGVFHLDAKYCSCETALLNAERGYRGAVQTNAAYAFCTQQLLKEAVLEQQLQEQTAAAVKNQEFKPYLQLIVDAQTQKITGAEMLSRWQSPAHGLLTPGKYIAIMEQAGTIADLDYYIFEEACRHLEYWANTGRGELSISCNFSRLTISQTDFAQRLISIASQYTFRRDRFILEITEDIMESNKQAALRNAKECRQFGFRLALDDMGSGYTSFVNLCDYPIDVIKVDRSIVVNSVLMERGSIMIDAIVAMAHKMGIKVVCEGVETDEQDAMVKRVGADLIQGFRYSRMIPLEETDRFMVKYSAQLNETL